MTGSGRDWYLDHKSMMRLKAALFAVPFIG
jgi:hypothetical protein